MTLPPSTTLLTSTANLSFLYATMGMADTAQTWAQGSSVPLNLVKSVTWDDIRLATASDPFFLLLDLIENGFLDCRNDLPNDIC